MHSPSITTKSSIVRTGVFFFLLFFFISQRLSAKSVEEKQGLLRAETIDTND